MEEIQFPLTQRQAAEYFQIGYDYFRNTYLPKILAIYEGLDGPTLKDAGGGLTEEGFKVVRAYVSAVKEDGKSHVDYKQEVREEILRLSAAASVAAAPVEVVTSLPAIIPALEPDSPQSVPGAVTTGSMVQVVQPLIQFHIGELHIPLPTAETSGIEQNTAALNTQTGQLVNVLAQYAAADLTAKVETVLAQNDNIAAGIQQNAAAETVKKIVLPRTGTGQS